MDVISIKPIRMVIGPDSICPFCSAHIKNKVGETFIEIDVSPEKCYQYTHPIGAGTGTGTNDIDNLLRVQFVYCPYCDKTSSKVLNCNKNMWINIEPLSEIKQFPNVPSELYKDYSEACAILNLSPTASATLSRRCLQKMVRERWGIEMNRLLDEINTIPTSNISQLERDALHAVRNIGNIGAHPDKILEVTSEDAELTIRIIELFLQKWYVDEPANKALLDSAIKKNREKQDLKNAK